ncbi:MAG: hypothetical protein RQ745_01560 [Longimicrobiales bacterium]|nr:hypothetical protein [Longimicrobiales bacterium]
MSRAFVNEDAQSLPEPDFSLPARDAEYYDEAAAWALIQGADAGYTREAETATGYRWGEPKLVPEIEGIRDRAEEEENLRVAQLARRFLRAAARNA